MRTPFTIIVLALLLFVSPAGATPKAPLSSVQTIDITGSVTTGAVVILTKDLARQFLQIQNVTQGTNNLACTTDGSTPAIGGHGVQLAGVASGAGGAVLYDVNVPLGAVTCIGSASSTLYTISYTP